MLILFFVFPLFYWFCLFFLSKNSSFRTDKYQLHSIQTYWEHLTHKQKKKHFTQTYTFLIRWHRHLGGSYRWKGEYICLFTASLFFLIACMFFLFLFWIQLASKHLKCSSLNYTYFIGPIIINIVPPNRFNEMKKTWVISYKQTLICSQIFNSFSIKKKK